LFEGTIHKFSTSAKKSATAKYMAKLQNKLYTCKKMEGSNFPLTSYWLVHVFSDNKNKRNKTHTHTYFLKKKITFDLLNFLKLSVHVFCLAENAKLCRTNSRTNCQQNKRGLLWHQFDFP
jgi:hypothetical protein